MPAFARDVLDVGPLGLGLLALGARASAPSPWASGSCAIRSAITRAASCSRPSPSSASAVIVFGLSKAVWLSVIALIVMGAADMVSVYVRASLVQLSTPDEVRGRVSAVNTVFIGASNELGEFRAGSMAALIGVVPSVVVGGLGTLLHRGHRCARLPRAPEHAPSRRALTCSHWSIRDVARNRHARRELGAPDGEVRLDAGHVGRGRQLVQNEILKRREIGRHAFQDVVALAGEHVGLAHERPAEHAVFEGAQIRFRLAMQPDQGESRELEAQRLLVDERRVAGDEPGFLERPHAPAGTGGADSPTRRASATLVIDPSAISSLRMRQSVASRRTDIEQTPLSAAAQKSHTAAFGL